jgi:hypothetical protein
MVFSHLHMGKVAKWGPISMALLEAGERYSDAMALFQIKRFTRIHEVHMALMGIPNLLKPADRQVLSFLSRCCNWSPTHQGGIPATFVSARELAKSSGYCEQTVEAALKHLGSEPYHEVDGGVIQRQPLKVIRNATEDEAAKVFESFHAREGRPPRVRVFRHPKYWDLPKWALEEFRKRLHESLVKEIW